MHRCRKNRSPTESASSTMRMSGSMWIATANARRTNIPLEYVFTGRSTNSPISANFSIEGIRWRVCASENPRIEAFKKMFSRPVNCGLNPQFTGRENIFLNRSEEHTSELQSLRHLVCRLLLEKKNMNYN